MIKPTNINEDSRVCTDHNQALVTVQHPPTHKDTAKAALLLVVIRLLMSKPGIKYENVVCISHSDTTSVVYVEEKSHLSCPQ
jgi:hypothetical protein